MTSKEDTKPESPEGKKEIKPKAFERPSISVNEALNCWAATVVSTGGGKSFALGMTRDFTKLPADEAGSLGAYVERTTGFDTARPVLRLVHVDGDSPKSLPKSDQAVYRSFRSILRGRLIADPWYPPTNHWVGCAEDEISVALSEVEESQRKKWGNAYREGMK